MGHSIRASERGLAIADQARQRRGWTKTSTARWWQDAHTSRATLRRFWRGERIQQDAFIAICRTVGLDDWQKIAEQTSPLMNEVPLMPSLVDWGTAPDLEPFYGRDQELHQLHTWVMEDRAKLIHISGLGGIGKTALILALAEQLQPQFAGILWRDISQLSASEDLLTELLDGPAQETKQLRNKLQQNRWLMILDNIDADDHWQVIYGLTTVRHQSCFLTVSPSPLPQKFQSLSRVYSLSLTGISADAAVQLLQYCGCKGHPHQLKVLAQIYGFNPLALRLMTSTIDTVFGGQIAPLLEQDTVVLPDAIRGLLQQQFQSLGELEKTVVFWLAIWQSPISLCRLQTHLLHPNSAVTALHGLLERSWVAQYFQGEHPSFSLQPMVMEFAMDELVADVLIELNQAQQQPKSPTFQRLRTHCLIRPGTDDILGDRILTAVHTKLQQQPTQPMLNLIDQWLQWTKEASPMGYLAFNLTLLKRMLQGVE